MAKRVIVIPAFNEAETIVNVLMRACPYADLIVIVDDGSTDNSGALVRTWAAGRPDVTLLALAENQGMSVALLVGFSYVLRLAERGLLGADDVVITIDADGQHLPEEIPSAVDTMLAGGADMLLGRRNLAGYPWFKHIGNWGLSLSASLLGGYRYRDVECGFRLMRIEVLADVVPFFTGRRYGCAQEIGVITARRGWKIDNSFPTRIACYRPGARVRDGVTNLWMGLTAFLRVVLGLRRPVAERIDAVLSLVAVAPTTATPVAVVPVAAASTSWTASS